MARKAIGNSKRFRIFERDGFRCQYCGRTPPAVVLRLDHIVPVAKGGADDEENLIAACFECNAGKAARLLSEQVIPRDYAALAEDAELRTEQLKAYRVHLENLRREFDQSIDLVGNEFWGPDLTWSYEKAHAKRVQVKRFLILLGIDVALEAAGIALRRFPDKDDWHRRWKYFCGICWNKCTERGIDGSGRRLEDENAQ